MYNVRVEKKEPEVLTHIPHNILCARVRVDALTNVCAFHSYNQELQQQQQHKVKYRISARTVRHAAKT